jgi:hypothetical protein
LPGRASATRPASASTTSIGAFFAHSTVK